MLPAVISEVLPSDAALCFRKVLVQVIAADPQEPDDLLNIADVQMDEIPVFSHLSDIRGDIMNPRLFHLPADLGKFLLTDPYLQ